MNYWICKFCRTKNLDAHRYCTKCLGNKRIAELKASDEDKSRE